MNYTLAIIILGAMLFVAAMIPYAYAPRCPNAGCETTSPY
jgi:hypothetical protein